MSSLLGLCAAHVRLANCAAVTARRIPLCRQQLLRRFTTPPRIRNAARGRVSATSFPQWRPRGARTLFSSSVIKQYVDLPPNYEDATGLPFRRRDLEKHEVAEIFGPNMNPAVANRLLRILHGRRVAGTLDDPEYRVNTAQYQAAAIDAALAYLRRTVPVDEVINAGLRAEDELAAMEEGEDIQTEPEAETETEPDKKEALQSLRAKKWQARLYKQMPEDDVYGVGAFDAIRARNRARYEAAELQRAAAEAERRAQEEREAAMRGGGRSLEAVDADGRRQRLPVREMSPRVQKWAMAATSTLPDAPSMSAWQRLWPSYVFVLSLVGGGAVVLLQMPGEAKDSGETEPGAFGLSPSAVTVLALIGANVAVAVLWRVPPLWWVMNRYMIVVPATPRPLSVLGAMFSHQKAGHLLANVLFLWFIGLRLHDEVGRAAFLETYLASGALAFLASLTNIVVRGNLHLTTLGASGAIYGITTAYFVLHKFESFKILGLPPDPYNGIQGLGFVGLMLGLNLLTMRAEKQAIDVVTHFVGMAVGAVFGEVFRRQRHEAAAARADGRPARSLWELLTESAEPAK